MTLATLLPGPVFKAVDLCAGPGGWDEGLRYAIPDAKVVGIEIDEAACATARKMGHHRVQADMTKLDPADFAEAFYLHASPPCQGFSLAGKGQGRLDGERLLQAIELIGAHPERVEEIIAVFAAKANSPLSALTLEPLRWIIRMGRPVWVTLEQVPTVLPAWEAYARALRMWGYSVWTGILHAETFGVPQTRRRAILIARRDGIEAAPPPPTHSRYYPRNPEKMDEGVLPWVSMAEGLGWGMTERPALTVAVGTKSGGTDPACVGGSGARRTLYRERDGGRWRERIINPTGGEIDSWPTRRPATTIVASFRPEIVRGPGYRKAGDGPCQNAPGAIRVEPDEAGILQGFRPDYPWSGGYSKRYEQVGNAVPPPLSYAVVRSMMEAS